MPIVVLTAGENVSTPLRNRPGRRCVAWFKFGFARSVYLPCITLASLDGKSVTGLVHWFFGGHLLSSGPLNRVWVPC